MNESDPIPTVRACERLIKVIQDPAQHAGLAAELRFAATLPVQFWAMQVDWSCPPPFPYIQTCVYPACWPGWNGGVTLSIDDRYRGFEIGTGRHLILDITDFRKVRYAFLDCRVGMRVLTPVQMSIPYMADRYADTKSVAQYCERLYDVEVIDHEALKSCWPEATWQASTSEEQTQGDNLISWIVAYSLTDE